MNSFTIKRPVSHNMGTFGILLDNTGWIVCTTAERPWLDNRTDISCIPSGVYQCSKHVSPSKGACISIHYVEGRTNVLMHSGNKPMEDSQGCILLGLGFGEWDNQPTVTSSRKALQKLLAMADDEFTLTIEDVS